MEIDYNELYGHGIEMIKGPNNGETAGFEALASFALNELIELVKEDPQRLATLIFSNAKHFQTLIDFLESNNYRN